MGCVAQELSTDTDDIEVVLARIVAAAGVAQERQAQLQHALDSRVVIEQAKGMLAERLGIGVEDAFELLRQRARSSRVRVHELARAVVERDASAEELRR
jgi:AmiR/NasT family two-component response regulator